ncbi:YncE family protein [Streptomyces sp. NPDC054987]
MLCATAALTGLAAAPPERPDPVVHVTNLHSDTVSVVDIRTGAVVDDIPVGDGPNGLAVDPDGSRVYPPRAPPYGRTTPPRRVSPKCWSVVVGDE